MPETVTVTVITTDACTTDARRDGDRLLVPVDRLADATGWELKPEGLCQGDVCIPVRDRSRLVDGDLIDLGGLGQALHQRSVIDAAEAVAAFSLVGPASPIGDALDAPDFTIADLAGEPVSLSDYDGRKKLLLAFASW